MMRRILAFTAPLVLGLAACTGTGDAQTGNAGESAVNDASVHPVSGLAVVPLTVTSGGTVHRFSVEYAGSAAAQQKGLMFRTELAPDEGMIFPNHPPQQRSFWMKNTVIPLDIIFIGPDGTIESIAANTTPYSLDPVASQGAVSGVLELAGGRAAQLGLKPGDAVSWQAPASAGEGAQ